jgi:hypothetical protein
MKPLRRAPASVPGQSIIIFRPVRFIRSALAARQKTGRDNLPILSDLLRRGGGLSGAEATAAAEWAMSALIQALRKSHTTNRQDYGN